MRKTLKEKDLSALWFDTLAGNAMGKGSERINMIYSTTGVHRCQRISDEVGAAVKKRDWGWTFKRGEVQSCRGKTEFASSWRQRGAAAARYEKLGRGVRMIDCAEIGGRSGARRKHYNEERPHSSLGYLTPSEFARRVAALRSPTAPCDAPLAPLLGSQAMQSGGSSVV